MIKEKQAIKIGDLRVLAEKAHNINKENGFWDTPPNIEQSKALMLGELLEALEAHRKNRFADKEAFQNWIATSFARPGLTDYQKEQIWKARFEDQIKDTLEDELADTIIRCMDMIIGYEWEESLVFERRDFKEQATFGSWVYGKIVWDFASTEMSTGRQYPGKASKDMIDHIITFCIFNDIDICWHIEQKIEYNRIRMGGGKGLRHGKAY